MSRFAGLRDQIERMELDMTQRLNKPGVLRDGEAAAVSITVHITRKIDFDIVPITPKIHSKTKNFAFIEPFDMSDVMLIDTICYICESVNAYSVAKRILIDNNNQPTRLVGNTHLTEINSRLGQRFGIRLARDAKDAHNFQFWKTDEH